LTRRLYYDDSHLRGFAATITSIQDRGGARWASLDATAFYPGGGGQPPDHGTIAGARVSDVEESSGEVWHRIEGAASIGEAVDCSLIPIIPIAGQNWVKYIVCKNYMKNR